MLTDASAFAVLAFAQCHRQPGVTAFAFVQSGFDGALLDALNSDAFGQIAQSLLIHPAINPNPVAPDPAGLR